MSFSQHKVAEDAVLSVAWPSAARVVVGSIPGTVSVFDVALEGKKGKAGAAVERVASVAPHALGARSLTFPASGEHFVSGGLHDSTVVLHAADGRVLALHTPAGVQETTCLAHSPAKLQVAVGTKSGAVRLVAYGQSMEDGSFSLREEASVPGGSAYVTGVAFNPDGSLLASVDSRGVLRVVDLETSAEVCAVHASPSGLRDVDWSADGREVYAAGDDHRVFVFDASGLAGGSPATSLPLMAALAGHMGFILAVSAAPDRSVVATAGNDRTIRVWDARKRECVATLDACADKVWSVCWSPDGKSVAAGTEAGTLVLWTPKM